MINIHWHVGETCKSRWFNKLVNDCTSIGYICGDWSWPIEKNSVVYKDTSFNKDDINILVSHIGRQINNGASSIVIYTNESFDDLDKLHKELLKCSEEYCDILIMCKP